MSYVGTKPVHPLKTFEQAFRFLGLQRDARNKKKPTWITSARLVNLIMVLFSLLYVAMRTVPLLYMPLTCTDSAKRPI